MSSDSNSVLDAIATRRSTRQFANAPVSQTDLQTVLQAGAHAPSAGNRQPWRFFLVQNHTVRNSVSAAMLHALEAQQLETSHELTKAEASSVYHSARAIEQAPVLVLVYSPLRSSQSGGSYALSDLQSIGACMQNMALAAHSLGISSLWICDVTYVAQRINELVDVRNHQLVAAMALGYTSPDADGYVAPMRSLTNSFLGSM